MEDKQQKAILIKALLQQCANVMFRAILLDTLMAAAAIVVGTATLNVYVESHSAGYHGNAYVWMFVSFAVVFCGLYCLASAAYTICYTAASVAIRGFMIESQPTSDGSTLSQNQHPAPRASNPKVN